MADVAAVDEKTIARAANILSNATHVLVLTGAGVSKESGIPTFRDAMTGLWANYDAHRLATPEGFQQDPQLVWQWYDHRRKRVGEVQPNPGHFAIAALAKKKLTSVITQNVDGLHQKAGSDPVIELHGNITTFICFDQHHKVENVPLGLEKPPKCEMCGSLVRPAVVWFGEPLSPGVMESAGILASTADVMLVVGTSGIVQPAASLPFTARHNGAKIIEVNPDATPITDIAEIFLSGPSGKILPQLVSSIKES